MTDTQVEYTDNEQVEDQDVESTDEGVAEKPAKEKAESKRVGIPSGYVTPIGFKNALVEQGKVAEDYRPQLVYAYVKNPGKKNPFPVKWTDGENVFDSREEANESAPEGKEGRPIVDLELAMVWWDEKEQRKADSATQKAAAAEAGTDEKPAKKSRSRKAKTEEVVEVDEADGLQEFTEAE